METKEMRQNGIDALRTVTKQCSTFEKPRIDQETTYIIISRPKFSNAIETFIEHKTNSGEIVAYYELEEIICSWVNHFKT